MVLGAELGSCSPQPWRSSEFTAMMGLAGDLCGFLACDAARNPLLWSLPSNWDLSTARATATVRLLIQIYDFKPERLAASGYAEYRPIATNNSAEGRAMNRRVDVVIPRKSGRP